MLFTVVFGVFMVIFSTINGCPSARPCRTPNGTNGTCIQAKDCPYISRFNNTNLSPEDINYIKKSICGIDLDKSKLFCCDDKEILLLKGQVKNKYDSDQISNTQTVVVEEVQPIQEIYSYINTSTTPAAVNQINTTPVAFSEAPTTTVKPPETVVYCQTPNGEKAQCIPILKCPILVRSLRLNTTTESQLRFLKESRCGFNNQSPLVCCGTDTSFKETEGENNQNFKQNPLISQSSCGIQSIEIEEQNPVPLIKQRFFQGTRHIRTTNFTLNNRIFGGTTSELGEFPWIALLAFESHDGTKMFACGGSLISSRYVLTAAHCVSGSGNTANKLTGVRLGEWDYGNVGQDCITSEGRTKCNDAEVNIGIESIHPHPEYWIASKEKYHDIALIRLDKDVKFTKFISPICLPNVDDYVSPGERLTISGWGLVSYNEETTIKQKVEVPVVSRSECSMMFEKSPRLSRVGGGQFCAGGEAGKDACVGDSGAPLMKKVKSNNSNSDIWFVEGIVSFGTGCGLVNRYGVYTKVSEYIGWIHNTIVS